MTTRDEYCFDLESDGLEDKVTRIHHIVLNNLNKEEILRYVDKEHRNVYKQYDGYLEQALEKLSGASLIVGHNILGYDIPVIKKVLDPNFEPQGIVRDTLLISRLIWTNLKDIDFAKVKSGSYPEGFKFYGQHNLKSWGYRLGVFKGTFGETNDWSEGTQEMLDYCVQDTVVTKKLWQLIVSKNYSEEAIELEHEFFKIIKRQMQFGFAFDVKKASDLYAVLVDRRFKIKEELQETFKGWHQTMKTPQYYEIDLGDACWRFPTKTETIQKAWEESKAAGFSYSKKLLASMVTEGELKKKYIAFNPGSRHHIARALRERYKWEPQVHTEKGEPKVDEEVLSSLVYPEAKLIAEYLMVEKRIGQLAEGKQAWLKLEKNGRIYGSVNTNGAVTGRCTHNHPNVAQTPACGAPYGGECRELFTVDKGYVLVGADASGLELRCLAHYMARWDNGDYGDVILNGDIHTVNQKAAGLPTRNNAKTFIYGFL